MLNILSNESNITVSKLQAALALCYLDELHKDGDYIIRLKDKINLSLKDISLYLKIDASLLSKRLNAFRKKR